MLRRRRFPAYVFPGRQLRVRCARTGAEVLKRRCRIRLYLHELRRSSRKHAASHRAEPVMKRVVAGLIIENGKLLVCQRTRHQTMPLKWEFPGGKIEEGEQPRDALRRELDEALGIAATIGAQLMPIPHAYPHGR